MGQALGHESIHLEKPPRKANRLFFAAHRLDLNAVVKQVIKQKGKRINATSKDTGATILHYAAANKVHGREIIQFLLSQNLHGIRVHAQDKNGVEPIHYAIIEGSLKTAEDLLKIRGVDAELLHFSVQQNQLDFARLVHAYDHDLIECPDVEGRNALHLAAEFADLRMCQWLVRKGLRVSTLCESSGDSVLHFAARNMKHGWEIILYFKHFLPAELDINELNNNDETPLHAALKIENLSAAMNIYRLQANYGVRLYREDLLEFCMAHNKLSSAEFVLKLDRQHDAGMHQKRKKKSRPAEKAKVVVKRSEWTSDDEQRPESPPKRHVEENRKKPVPAPAVKRFDANQLVLEVHKSELFQKMREMCK